MNAQPLPATAAPLPEIERALARFRLRARLRLLWSAFLSEQSGASTAELLDRDAPGEMERWIEHDEEARRLCRAIAHIERPLPSGAEGPFAREEPVPDAAEGAVARAEPLPGAVEGRFARDQPLPSGAPEGRFAQIVSRFGLTVAERDLLEACAAVALDPGLRDLCAVLTGTPCVTPRLVARLHRHGRTGAWTCSSPLFRWEFIRQQEVGGGEAELTLDPAVRDWLRGEECEPELLAGRAASHGPLPPLAGWPFRTLVQTLQAQLNTTPIRPIRVIVTGAPGSGRRTFAAAVSAALGLPLLAIDVSEMDEPSWRRLYLQAQRQAFLDGSALAWHGEGAARRSWPGGVSAFPLQFVTCETAREAVRHRELIEYTVELRPPSILERTRLWTEHAPEDWSRTEVEELAHRYRVSVGDITRVCTTSVRSPAEAANRLREVSRTHLTELAQLLPCSFTWDDLVLPAHVMETLRDFVYEAQHRSSLWEQPAAQRLFPLGRGLIGLFSGSSGTGKTMAAQIIAASMGYDLYRIDLSAVVSKYVGETSQNIERILRRAADMDVVLFFDEADAMFARRTTDIRDAQDKFANTDAAHLLQAIESYPGVAVLATNQKTSMDQAFLRRIRYLIEFPKPEMAHRLEIWKRLIRELAGTDYLESLAPDITALARDLDVTGAQIKNAVLGAMFIARRMGNELTAEHLLLGLEREIAKEGRTLSAKERERIRRT